MLLLYSTPLFFYTRDGYIAQVKQSDETQSYVETPPNFLHIKPPKKGDLFPKFYDGIPFQCFLPGFGHFILQVTQ